MVKLAANLTLMFNELSFLDRFNAAARAGFQAVEFMFPYEWSEGEVAKQASDAGVSVVLFNTPAGDWSAGERGLASLPDRVSQFREGVKTALDYAGSLSCTRLHVMAGLLPADADCARHRGTLVENVAFAADMAGEHDIEVVLEPINTKVNVPGYFYDTTGEVISVIDEVARPNVKLLFDIYHRQVMEGDLARPIEQHLTMIGHMQLADNPGRHEPGTGEINYAWLLPWLDDIGYDGWVGCEYKPAATTEQGLGWTRPYFN